MLPSVLKHQAQNKSCFAKLRQKVSEDAGYFAAQEMLECLPVRPIARHPENDDFSAFVAQNTRYCENMNLQQRIFANIAPCRKVVFSRKLEINLPKIMELTCFPGNLPIILGFYAVLGTRYPWGYDPYM